MELSPEVSSFLEGRDQTIVDMILALRELVHSTVPGLIEQIDRPADMLAYGFKRTYKDMVCVIMIQKGYVNLGFPRGAELADPAGLLEGTGRKARHVKIHTAAEAENPALLMLLKQSAERVRI